MCESKGCDLLGMPWRMFVEWEGGWDQRRRGCSDLCVSVKRADLKRENTETEMTLDEGLKMSRVRMNQRRVDCRLVCTSVRGCGGGEGIDVKFRLI
jgi:hypothetical protein